MVAETVTIAPSRTIFLRRLNLKLEEEEPALDDVGQLSWFRTKSFQVKLSAAE